MRHRAGLARPAPRPSPLRSPMRFSRPRASAGGFAVCRSGPKILCKQTRRNHMRTTLCIALATLAVTPAYSQRGGGAPQALAIQPVKPDMYMITGAGGNTTVRITDAGLIVVDGKLNGEANYNSLMALIKGVSDKPIKYLIVTHHHADHTGNNQRFLDAGVQIVATANLNANLLTY